MDIGARKFATLYFKIFLMYGNVLVFPFLWDSIVFFVKIF